MSSFYTSNDETVQALLAEHKQGNPDALPTMQQLFFDKHYGKGVLDVEALKSDEFIATQRDLLAKDEVGAYTSGSSPCCRKRQSDKARWLTRALPDL